MLGRRFVAMVAGAFLGVSVLGSGGVGAQTAGPQRFSDQARFSGVAFPGPGPGTYTFTSQACSLVSDPVAPGTPNEGPFDCQLTAQIRLFSERDATATVTSSDGTTTWSFTLTPSEESSQGQRTWTISGKGTETDAPEANSPTSTANPVTVSGSVTVFFTPFGFLLVTGSERFSESATAP
jgi:hypothetical protein